MPHPGAGADPLFLAFQQALAGRYSIDRELGRGGTGVVYLAREVHLDRLSLSMAAEHLFDSLPEESRQSPGDLPELLPRPIAATPA